MIISIFVKVLGPNANSFVTKCAPQGFLSKRIFSFISTNLNIFCCLGPGEMAQQLRMLSAFLEDLNSVP